MSLYKVKEFMHNALVCDVQFMTFCRMVSAVHWLPLATTLPWLGANDISPLR